MADYDFNEDLFEEDTEEKSEKKSLSIETLDIFSILLLVLTLCLGAYFAVVLFNPQTPLNPFPPNTPVLPVFTPSATNTPLQLSTPWTKTPTIQPTITQTPRPTFTSIPTETPVILYTETFTPEPPTATATPEMPFEANVQLIDSKIIHPETNCDWLGVGGSIEDLDGGQMFGVVVIVQGTLLGNTVDITQVSGMSQAYGQSGFEFFLADVPVPSEDTLKIRLFDSAGMPLSDEIFFSTSGECDKNLVLVHFNQVR